MSKDDHDRLSLRQRAGLRSYKPKRHDDGWFFLIIPILLAIAIIGVGYCVFGCDANALKIVWGGKQDEPTSQPSIPSRTHFENTQKLAREADHNSEQTLTKLEKWEAYGEIGIPLLITLYGSLKTYNAYKRRKGRAS